MIPERKPCARHPSSFPVQIRYGKRRLHGADGCDPSSEGLYLRVRAVTLPEGTPVELEIDAPGRQWLVPAVVTHCDDSGIGVSFLEPQPQLLSDLAGANALRPFQAPQVPLRAPLLQRPGH
jgi:hypothetical protein